MTTECPMKALSGKPGGRRNKGRAYARWIDGVEGDLGRIGVKRWRRQTEDRATWRDICRTARFLHENCSATDDNDDGVYHKYV